MKVQSSFAGDRVAKQNNLLLLVIAFHHSFSHRLRVTQHTGRKSVRLDLLLLRDRLLHHPDALREARHLAPHERAVLAHRGNHVALLLREHLARGGQANRGEESHRFQVPLTPRLCRSVLSKENVQK